MRYFNPQYSQPVSQFIPDTTNWEMLAKLAEQNNQEYDKAELEAEKIGKVLPGYSTIESANIANARIEAGKAKAQAGFANNDLKTFKKGIYEAQQALLSDEAIDAKNDYEYTKANAKAIAEGYNSPMTYQTYWNPETKSFTQHRGKAGTFNPIAHYGSYKGNTIDKDFKYVPDMIMEDIQKYVNDGAEIKTLNDENGVPYHYLVSKGGVEIKKLDEPYIRERVARTLQNFDLESTGYSGYNKRKNPDYNNQNLIDDVTNFAMLKAHKYITESAPTFQKMGQAEKNNSGNDGASKERALNIDALKDNNILKDSKVPIKTPNGEVEMVTPTSVSHLEKAAETANPSEAGNSILASYNVEPINIGIPLENLTQKQLVAVLTSGDAKHPARFTDKAEAEAVARDMMEKMTNVSAEKADYLDAITNADNEVKKRLEFKGKNINPDAPENIKFVKGITDKVNQELETVEQVGHYYRNSDEFMESPWLPSLYQSMATTPEQKELITQYQKLTSGDAKKDEYLKQEFLSKFEKLKTDEYLSASNTPIGRYTKQKNEVVEREFQATDQFMRGTNLENTFFANEETGLGKDNVGNRFKSSIEDPGKINEFTWTDKKGRTNETLKDEYKDKLAGMKVTNSGLFYDVPSKKYLAKNIISEANGDANSAKIIYLDVTSKVNDKNPNSSTSLAGTSWVNGNAKESDIYEHSVKGLTTGNTRSYKPDKYTDDKGQPVIKIKENKKDNWFLEVKLPDGQVASNNYDSFAEMSKMINTAELLWDAKYKNSTGGARVGEYKPIQIQIPPK